MKTIQIEINDKIYNVLLAQTEEEKEQGLMNVEELDSNEGMLFIYDSPQHVDFWMKDTEIPLDIIFIDEDLEVISVKQGTPLSEEYISEGNVQFVLELNQNSGVKPGDDVDIEDDLFEDENSELEPNKIYIIGPDGKPQAEILGGERIFSIKNTKTLIRMAKRAFMSKKESDYKKLGKKIFEYFHTQDTNKPEYTNIKENE